MDQMHAAPEVPHIIQVYQPSVSSTKLQNPQLLHVTHPTLQTTNKITYEQTITSESLRVPVSEQLPSQVQRQIVMSCQQTHLQSMSAMQSQVLQSTELGQPIQFTSHVILPQVPIFKQHVLVEGQQYIEQFNTYLKDQFTPSVVTKLQLEPLPSEEKASFKQDDSVQKEQQLPKKKRTKSLMPNPSSWACNVRKTKHQRGEAYINRRGKYIPERTIRNTKNCRTLCKYKCNERISDADRETIFKSFYSLNANEKKYFLLNTTERNISKSRKSINSKRKYAFKYFFSIRGVKYIVCKEFFLGTLAISQKPVYNVHLSKSEMNIPKPDGRGSSETSTHALPPGIKDRVRKHIMSFKTVNSKPIKQYSRKKQYLDPSLNVKKMYLMYVSECTKENVPIVKESMYRKIFKQEFNLHIKKEKSDQQLCCKCKGPVKKK